MAAVYGITGIMIEPPPGGRLLGSPPDAHRWLGYQPPTAVYWRGHWMPALRAMQSAAAKWDGDPDVINEYSDSRQALVVWWGGSLVEAGWNHLEAKIRAGDCTHLPPGLVISVSPTMAQVIELVSAAQAVGLGTSIMLTTADGGTG